MAESGVRSRDGERPAGTGRGGGELAGRRTGRARGGSLLLRGGEVAAIVLGFRPGAGEWGGGKQRGSGAEGWGGGERACAAGGRAAALRGSVSSQRWGRVIPGGKAGGLPPPQAPHGLPGWGRAGISLLGSGWSQVGLKINVFLRRTLLEALAYGKRKELTEKSR